MKVIPEMCTKLDINVFIALYKELSSPDRHFS